MVVRTLQVAPYEHLMKLSEKRPVLTTMSAEDRERELELRIDSMEKAMATLDQEGLFGSGSRRLSIVINAEVMLADYENTKRGLRLNLEAALNEWLEAIAEEP